jgi:hypothetical protein
VCPLTKITKWKLCVLWEGDVPLDIEGYVTNVSKTIRPRSFNISLGLRAKKKPDCVIYVYNVSIDLKETDLFPITYWDFNFL